MDENKKIFTSNIKKLMKMHNVSREIVADAINVKYTTFCDWAKGRTNPKINYVIDIANYFEVKLDALLEENPCYEISHENFLKDKLKKEPTFTVYKQSNKLIDNVDLEVARTESVPIKWLFNNKKEILNKNYIGYILPDNSMEPNYKKNNTVVVEVNDKFLKDGDYLIQSLKNNVYKTMFRRLKIENDHIVIFPLNPVNEIHASATYIKKDEFNSKYIIIGKIKRYISDFEI